MISSVTDEIVGLQALLDAAPTGRLRLDPIELSALHSATQHLVDGRGELGQRELTRFIGTRSRSIDVESRSLKAAHLGQTVLVTGGTGCIGSSLIGQLLELGVHRVVSVSRGLETRWPRYPGVEYLSVDVRNAPAIHRTFTSVQPDIVYHLAAQHDPGLAELESARTLATNVGGTRNVLAACRSLHGVRLACASTGKAMRPHTRDVYAVSKKITEWLLSQAAADPALTVSAVRFTHVVDNSIILGRLLDWTGLGVPIRLHDVQAVFYLQSAREAGRLLLSSVLDATPGSLSISAIRDLDWPIALLDLAVGVLASRRGSSPLYCCGAEAGYELAPYPGLYDPVISGLRSPLFNAFEVAAVDGSKHSADVDVLRVSVCPEPAIEALVATICSASIAGRSPEELRELANRCGWAILQQFLTLVPTGVLSRHLRLVDKVPPSEFSPDDGTVRSLVRGEMSARSDHYSAGIAGHAVSHAGG